MVTVHELMAWGLDEYVYRNSEAGLSELQVAEMANRAAQKLAERSCYQSCEVLLDEETSHIQHLLDLHVQRVELRQEYDGLEWTLGVVDLRHVLAFQRRLVFDPKFELPQVPTQENWPALVSFSLGAVRSVAHSIIPHENDGQKMEFSLQSDNPDLQLRPVAGAQPHEMRPFSLYGGSPFFEVAEFGRRWFLRDGYHRAYRLLRAGVHHVPVVVIRARTMEELGATQSWFFDEEQLFSPHPPRVMDFLSDDLVLRYQRQRFRKTIRIRIEESLQPVDEADEVQGDKV
jgi:hypothetical protein